MQVSPATHARWSAVPGDSDEDKLLHLLDTADVA
jgi:hypothetical protein